MNGRCSLTLGQQKPLVRQKDPPGQPSANNQCCQRLLVSIWYVIAAVVVQEGDGVIQANLQFSTQHVSPSSG